MYKNFVKFVNKTDNHDYDTISQSNFQKTIWFCKDAQHPDCSVTDIGYLYADKHSTCTLFVIQIELAVTARVLLVTAYKSHFNLM